jgi:hypothetical protein
MVEQRARKNIHVKSIRALEVSVHDVLGMNRIRVGHRSTIELSRHAALYPLGAEILLFMSY